VTSDPTAAPAATATGGDPVSFPSEALQNVLLGHLMSAPACCWPGGDGIFVADVLRQYPTAAATRYVPGELDLCGSHPDLATQVVAFFFLLTPAEGLHV
jgi:hypothetical protein